MEMVMCWLQWFQAETLGRKQRTISALRQLGQTRLGAQMAQLAITMQLPPQTTVLVIMAKLIIWMPIRTGMVAALEATPACLWRLQDTFVSGDCNDANSTMYPNAPGTGIGVDNNCNGIIDLEEEAPVPCPEDLNQDGSVTVADVLAVLAEFGCDAGCAG